MLNLSRSGLGDAGACHIAEALAPRWCPAGAGASPGGGAAAATLGGASGGAGRWVFNPKLRELHLGGATIGPEGAKALARAITPQRNNIIAYNPRNSTESQQTSLQSSQQTSQQTSQASQASQWAFNQSLQVLDLRDNVIGREGMEAIAVGRCTLTPPDP